MKHRIIAVGEILWDLLPGGRVLGGAPANFAIHAHALGADIQIVSRIGRDPLGQEVLDSLRARGISAELIGIDESLPTGTVSVELERGQPHYVIHENVAWDAIDANEAALAALQEADAVCFGSLAQRSPRSRIAVQGLVGATRPDALRIFDINLRQTYYSREVLEPSLRLANVLKLNEAELPVLAEMFGLRGDTREQLLELSRRFDLRGTVYTRGAQGSLVWFDGESSEHEGVATEVRDTVGAGDAFTAALVTGLLAGEPLATIHARASAVAAYVCAHDGPTPPLPERFRDG